MLEFRIVVQQGKGKPYSLWSFDSFEKCYGQLLEFIKEKKNLVNKKYYVLNDFFENEYISTLDNLTLYNIQVREISAWRDYTEKVNSKNKVLYFK